MVQFASYLRRVLCKTRLIFPRINGPNDNDNENENIFLEDPRRWLQKPILKLTFHLFLLTYYLSKYFAC